MSKKNQYDVLKLYGLPVEMDNSGKYQIKFDNEGSAKIHTWRIGKHTKGKFTHPGQLMLTENNLTVLILKAEAMAFKDRHSETPMQRFLTVEVTSDTLKQGQALMEK
ncbi:hypothetical protein H5993_01655 [Lactobacillus alvi]|uniref:DUF7671 domain-containing protein n=1 Tax=Limosilactobacillus alvi TaxID=990412 RepID=A0ABS2ELZ4_9LACO|nr:hypothetical protein [Limosilactobacillus alvi]MBM6753474.1 hypothetical protein [Limosilactobacillus alvi]